MRERPAKRRVLLIAVAAAVLVAVGVVVWLLVRGGHGGSDTLVLQGNVDVREVNLAFQVPGRIDSLAVDEGDSVHAGQAIASLDAGYFDDAAREARAALDTAKAEL